MCWFKTENAEEMLKMIRPAMWLLERYNHPYYVVYTNTPGEIVYEDKYQIAAKADGVLQIDELKQTGFFKLTSCSRPGRRKKRNEKFTFFL